MNAGPSPMTCRTIGFVMAALLATVALGYLWALLVRFVG